MDVNVVTYVTKYLRSLVFTHFYYSIALKRKYAMITDYSVTYVRT